MLLALLLGLRLLTPTGFMPAFDHGAVTIVACPAVGWLLTIFAVAFCAQVFWFVDSHSHWATDTLYGIFPFWVPTLLALAWIADRTGGRR